MSDRPEFTPPRRRPRSSNYPLADILGGLAIGLLVMAIAGLGLYRLLTGLAF